MGGDHRELDLVALAQRHAVLHLADVEEQLLAGLVLVGEEAVLVCRRGEVCLFDRNSTGLEGSGRAGRERDETKKCSGNRDRQQSDENTNDRSTCSMYQ